MSLNSFEDLKCWKACHELRGWVKALIKDWPRDERFDLTDQIRRCSRSSCRNLAEGFGRNYSKDNARFCRTAVGSLHETLDILIDANQSEIIDDETMTHGRKLVSTALQLTQGYIRYLLKHDNNLKEPEADYTISIWTES